MFRYLLNKNTTLGLFLGCLALFSLPAHSYYLLANGDPSLTYPQKWGPNVWGSGATITWSYASDGVTSNIVDFQGNAVYNGTNTLSSFIADFDSANGANAFEKALSNAFHTWEAAANVKFVQASDDGTIFGASISTDIRIAAFDFANNCCGAAGYGPPGNSAFPDPVAGDLALNTNAFFKVYPYTEGTPYQSGDYQNDLESLLVHEIGHTLGLGHPESDGLQGIESLAIMCVDASCNEMTHLQRQLGADDIAAAQFIYGAPVVVPVPSGIGLLGSGLLMLFSRKRLLR